MQIRITNHPYPPTLDMYDTVNGQGKFKIEFIFVRLDKPNLRQFPMHPNTLVSRYRNKKKMLWKLYGYNMTNGGKYICEKTVIKFEYRIDMKYVYTDLI